MKKVQTTLGNIMNLDSAAITVNNRLTALRSSHSQRLAAKVPSRLLLIPYLLAPLFTVNMTNWSKQFSRWAHSMGPYIAVPSVTRCRCCRRRRCCCCGHRHAVANGPNIFQMLLVATCNIDWTRCVFIVTVADIKYDQNQLMLLVMWFY